MEVSGQLHAPPLYFRGNSPRYLLDRRLGGSQNQFGRGGEEKNSLLLSKSKLGRPGRSLDTKLTEPLRLLA